MPINFVALARVSSREQEREGFSLEVQESALRRYAENHGGEITKLWRIAETASKHEERKVFKEMLAYCKTNAADIAGVLFYKVDRAARNLYDYVEVERLQTDHGIPVEYVTQPTENSPAGRMQRRILAGMAAFFTEQLSVDVREGLERRVKSGLFVGVAPYGYRNARKDGRRTIETDPEQASIVRRIFDLYANTRATIDSIRETLDRQEIYYTQTQRQFTRSKIHVILTDRSYIGDVRYRGQWYTGGTHEPLIDRATFDRVQALLGGHTYQSSDLVYSGGVITCGHCGRAVTGERIRKRMKSGDRFYTYYRCSAYNSAGHPRTRVTEAKLDADVLALFGRLRIEDSRLRAWIVRVLKAKNAVGREASAQEHDRLHRELQRARREADTLLSLRLNEEITPDTFKTKNAEIDQRIARLELAAKVIDKGDGENRDLALRVFELSQTLSEKWVNADAQTKRALLDILCLNSRLEGESLILTLREPFELLANGSLFENGSGGRI